MTIGLGVIVFLKVQRNGLLLADWKDVAFYLAVPVAAALVANMLFARIRLTDDQIEIVGLLSRKRSPLRDVTDVSTERGANAKFKLRDGHWVSLPTWLGGRAWGVAAALRHRVKRDVAVHVEE